jgi:hypothetical protein
MGFSSNSHSRTRPTTIGVAEHKNCMFQDIILYSLQYGDLPTRLYAEAICATCIITNL